MATTCRSCGYAYEGKRCTNPACKTVNPEAHARHKAEGDRRRAEQAERDRLRQSANRSMAQSAARSADRTRRERLAKARSVGGSRSYRTADGGTLTVREASGGRWSVIESPKGGLAGGTMLFGSRKAAEEYVTKRRRVIAGRR